MQNKFLGTWIIAAFLFCALAVFSLLPAFSSDTNGENGLISSDYVIFSGDMSEANDEKVQRN